MASKMTKWTDIFYAFVKKYHIVYREYFNECWKQYGVELLHISEDDYYDQDVRRIKCRDPKQVYDQGEFIIEEASTPSRARKKLLLGLCGKDIISLHYGHYSPFCHFDSIEELAMRLMLDGYEV